VTKRAEDLTIADVQATEANPTAWRINDYLMKKKVEEKDKI
jgi:hypothetical protein